MSDKSKINNNHSQNNLEFLQVSYRWHVISKDEPTQVI